MLLKNILPDCPKKFSELEISGISCDSRNVKKNYAFVCIKGTVSDGHKFAKSAYMSGASVIIAEEDTGLENQVIVSDTHFIYSKMCANWFGNPTDSLKLIGVTGTNGKTTVTYMIKKILEGAGYKVGLIGTIQNMIGDEIIVSHNTTPNAYELNSLFALMKAKGCTYVIMEVSSHALEQRRVCDLTFEVAIFTNLTQDHLDYHKTMENYLAAKKRLFAMCKKAIINFDDDYAERIMENLECDIVTYSLNDNSTYSAKGINYRPSNVEYELVGDNIIHHIRVNTGGKFTVYNSMAAAVTALELGIDIGVISEEINHLEGVKGRAEAVPCDMGFTIIIDYAHTPDGLKNILTTFKECQKNRLIAVFGCGGDRDRAKRAVMGSIAVRNADYVIVTSDNPRSEEPMAIINDILEGTVDSGTPVKVIENRVEAIKYAISIACQDDIIILAGKGHETYQILKSGTIHLDEREIIREALDDLKKQKRR